MGRHQKTNDDVVYYSIAALRVPLLEACRAILKTYRPNLDPDRIKEMLRVELAHLDEVRPVLEVVAELGSAIDRLIALGKTYESAKLHRGTESAGRSPAPQFRGNLDSVVAAAGEVALRFRTELLSALFLLRPVVSQALGSEEAPRNTRWRAKLPGERDLIAIRFDTREEADFGHSGGENEHLEVAAAAYFLAGNMPSLSDTAKETGVTIEDVLKAEVETMRKALPRIADRYEAPANLPKSRCAS